MKLIDEWKQLLSGELDRPAWRDEEYGREAILPGSNDSHSANSGPIGTSPDAPDSSNASGPLDTSDSSDAPGSSESYDSSDSSESGPSASSLLRAVKRCVDDYASRSEYLKALSILKLANASGLPEDCLKPVLNELLRVQSSRNRDGQDPLPREFLGTPRLHIAWSVLTRDRLAIVPDEPILGSDCWIVARGTDVGPTATPWALVWWGRTEVAGKVRPAGRRTVSRRKLELTAAVALLGRANPRQGPTRFTAQITDLTPRGAGIEVKDRFDRLHGIQLKDKKIRIALCVPGRGEPISTLGLICWTEEKGDERDIRMGIKFVDPLPEFMEGVAELLSGRRDVQYLWNLVESNIGQAENTGKLGNA